MILTICSSLDFVDKIKEVSGELEVMGHQVLLPGELAQADIIKEKQNGALSKG